MMTEWKRILPPLMIAAAGFCSIGTALGLEVNQSGLWFGGDQGIESRVPLLRKS